MVLTQVGFATIIPVSYNNAFSPYDKNAYGLADNKNDIAMKKQKKRKLNHDLLLHNSTDRLSRWEVDGFLQIFIRKAVFCVLPSHVLLFVTFLE